MATMNCNNCFNMTAQLKNQDSLFVQYMNETKKAAEKAAEKADKNAKEAAEKADKNFKEAAEKAEKNFKEAAEKAEKNFKEAEKNFKETIEKIEENAKEVAKDVAMEVVKKAEKVAKDVVKEAEKVTQSNKATRREQEKQANARVEKVSKDAKVARTEQTKQSDAQMAKMNAKHDKLVAEHGKLAVGHGKLAVEHGKLAAKHDKLVNTLSAREIGNLADINVLNKIFPNCRRKNFGIRTLAELKLFFDDININNELVSPTTTKTSWFKLSLNHRNEIRKRYDDMLISHPDLIQSIDILKKHWEFAHTISGDGIIESTYFSGINEKCISLAIICCVPHIPKNKLNQ